MMLQSLEIKNFRQFYSVHKIEFSTDPKRNVTLIHAENGVGKTAFLNAILWCFYERTTKNFQMPDKILNNHAKEQGEESYYVHIMFIENDVSYTVQRSFNQLNGKTFRVFRLEADGNYEQVPNPTYFLNAIIPSDMASYFFFQGEGMGSITEGKNKNSIRDAVRDILGFTVAEKALQTIRAAKSELRKEYQRLDKKSVISEKQGQLSDLEQELEPIRTEIEECESNEKALEAKLADIDEYLRNSNHEVVKQKQLARDSKKRELDQIQSAIDKAKKDRVKLVRDYAISTFAQKAASKGIEFIDEEELKGKIPAPYNTQLVEDILESAKCICGADVRPGTEAFGHIQELLGKAADPMLINRVTRARSQLSAIKRDLRNALPNFEETLKYLSDSEASYERVRSELENLSLEIQDVDFENVKNNEIQRKEFNSQLNEAMRRAGALKTRFDQKKQQIDTLGKELERLKGSEPEAQKFNERIQFAKDLEQKLESELEETEGSTIGILSSEINKFLKKFVRQDFIATISRDYSLVLKDRQGEPVGKSDGQTLLLSLTFISALINIAKLRAGAKGSILTPGAVAPFVIDAPFGVLDNTYKGNVAAEIPNSVNQVIFLLSSSHWEGTVENAIRDKVGVEYNMVLEVAAPQAEKEIDYINVQGTSYPTVCYEAEVDRTAIERIV